MQRIVILNYNLGEVIIRNFSEDLDSAEDWFDSKYNDLELREADFQRSRHYLESLHYSVLHRGRVLLSGIEGEAAAGQVKWLNMKNI